MKSDKVIIQELRRDLEDGLGYDYDVLSEIRSKALNYYQGEMQAAAKGRSNIVSFDVADTVNALMAQATGIYKGSQVEFPATSAEDEEQAQMESDVIKTILEQNDEFKVFESATFDALLQGNGWIKIKAVTEEQTSQRKIPGLLAPEEKLVFEDQQDAFGASIELDEDEENEETIIRTTIEVERLDIKSVAPENIIYSGDDDCDDIQELRLVAERKLMTQADLIEAGLSRYKAESVPDYQDSDWEGELARAGKYSDYTDTEAAQESARLKETFICYWLCDLNNDNKLSRWKIHIAGSYIISKEPCSLVPYVTGSPLPMPHRVRGQGMYEIMKQVQDAKTGIMRQYMDNLNVMNQSRVGYIRGEVDLDDLLSGRINGAVAMDRPDAIIPLPSNDIGAQAIGGLNYLDEVRTQRGGAALDLNNSEMQIAQSSALAASQEYKAKEKMASYYCKNLANTLLKNTFLMAHRLLREEMTEPVSAKIKGQWVEVNPGDWAPRLRAKVNVGLSDTEKSQRIMMLNSMIQQQEQWIQSGMEGILTDKAKLYNAARDWIEASDITDHPDSYLINPESPEAQQAAQAMAEQAQAQEQQMAQMQEQMAQMSMQMEQMKQAHEKDLKEMELQFKYFDSLLDADMKEAEMSVSFSDNLINKAANNARTNDTGNSPAST